VTTTQHAKVTYHWAIQAPSNLNLASGIWTNTIIINNCGWPLSEEEFDEVESHLKDRVWEHDIALKLKEEHDQTRVTVNIVFLHQLRAPNAL
jgi:hypothetical protein